MAVRKVNFTDNILVYTIYENNEVVFVGYTELGVFGITQKTEEFTKVQIASGFKNASEAKDYQNSLIIKYNPIFNNRLNDRAITFGKLLKMFKSVQPVDVRNYRKAIKQLKIECIEYQGIKYIQNQDIFALCDYFGIKLPIHKLELLPEYHEYQNQKGESESD